MDTQEILIQVNSAHQHLILPTHLKEKLKLENNYLARFRKELIY